MDKIEKDILGD